MVKRHGGDLGSDRSTKSTPMPMHKPKPHSKFWGIKHKQGKNQNPKKAKARSVHQLFAHIPKSYNDCKTYEERKGWYEYRPWDFIWQRFS